MTAAQLLYSRDFSRLSWDGGLRELFFSGRVIVLTRFTPSRHFARTERRPELVPVLRLETLAILVFVATP